MHAENLKHKPLTSIDTPPTLCKHPDAAHQERSTDLPQSQNDRSIITVSLSALEIVLGFKEMVLEDSAIHTVYRFCRQDDSSRVLWLVCKPV